MAQLSFFDVGMLPEVPRQRSLVRPLDRAEAIYHVLPNLPIGAEVPAHILIADYEGGEIPIWVVQEREHAGVVQILTVVDKSTTHQNLSGNTEALAIEVFTAPAKTLAAPVYVWSPGSTKRRDQLSDIRQHARQMNDRSAQ